MMPFGFAGAAGTNAWPGERQENYNMQNPIYLGGDGLTYTLTRPSRNPGSWAGAYAVDPPPPAQHAPVSGERVGGNEAVRNADPLPPAQHAPVSGGSVGGNGAVGNADPLPPAQHAPVSGGSIGGNGAVGNAEQHHGCIRVIEPELRWRMWIPFVVGKIASIICIAFEMSNIDVCFEEYASGIEDSSLESVDLAEVLDYDAQRTRIFVWVVLVVGLVVEIVSAVGLSRIYRSPLDTKSVHKIPYNDLRSPEGNIMVFVLAPFSWAVIYFFGGYASVLYGTYTSCSGRGGQALAVYLNVSGVFMVLIGLVCFASSVLILFFSCGSPSRCTDGCCEKARRFISRKILSRGPCLEIFWIIQGVVWSFRAGDPGQTILVVMGVSLSLVVVCTGGHVAIRFVFPKAMSNT